MEIEEQVQAHRDFFETGVTLNTGYRLGVLKHLHRVITDNEYRIAAALEADLGKSDHESYMCEIGLTLSELSYQIKHLKSWAKPHRVATGLANFHAKSFTVAEPYGVTLIMSPWNYPFMLTMEPLIGAVAAGNCAVVKPSAYSPNTSQLISELIDRCFEAGHVSCVLGGREENTELLEQQFDMIFFTGSKAVGKTVLEKASRWLTPVTLELGGKSPCIIAADANLDIAAKRIAFGKYLNCGQTCVAPDYVLIDAQIKGAFIEKLLPCIRNMYGENPLENDDYGKIINQKHYDRICGLIDAGEVILGGERDADTLRIAPTVLDEVSDTDPVMQEEIFGPVLPILTYQNIDEALDFVRRHDKPLALYLFTKDKELEDRVVEEVPFGGGCINDTIVHLTNPHMGFGGVGASGMGSYHGHESFATFSHIKSIMKKYTWIDLPMRYQPYKERNDRLVHMFLK
ncbi:MAG: aldehyde dehydrogenase [Coriobacteriaceae bacterium]|nr:aldehyde dehydrogenase [Coriobacteriaceae bacterium]